MFICTWVYVGKFKNANLKTSETIQNRQIAKITARENYHFYSSWYLFVEGVAKQAAKHKCFDLFLNPKHLPAEMLDLWADICPTHPVSAVETMS